VWQSAAWYRALSLTERLESGEALGSSAPATHADRAHGRVRAWKAQKPFGREQLFAERLALDSLSERELLSLLAEPDEALKDRISRDPAWLVALRRAYLEPDADPRLMLLLDECGRDHPLARWLPALGPLLRRALDSLQESVKSLGRGYEVLPVDTKLLARSFLDNVIPTVLYQISKAAVLEMNIERLRGNLRGDTPQARFEYFVRQQDRDGFICYFLVKYPVLARQLVLTVEQWTAYVSEFLTHLCADWKSIGETFADGGDPGPLVEVEAGKGDRHRGGRSVLLLRFRSGLRLLYKPKPLAVDVHFQELLSWLNDRGAQPYLRPLVLIDRGDYGWSEFVAASSCDSAEEVARFYERQGCFLALLYALHATDLHNENLVAVGEHPALVDLEALFHPHVHAGDPVLAANPAALALDQSVWQVGILPRRIWSDEESPGVDMSGLGGHAGQLNPHSVVSWEDPESDEMRIGRRQVELPAAENQPRLRGKSVHVLDHQEEIIAGFTRMYTLLRRHRTELLAEQLPRFAQDEIRVVVRSTNVYGLLWYESFHPDVLRDALDRDRFFDHLWAEVEQRPQLARVIRAEQEDLRQGDIPVFSTRPDSRAIFTSAGERVPGFFETPSLELVRRRVERLGEEDLRKQIWIIEASLATLRMDREDKIGRPLAPIPRSHPVKQETLLVLAGAAGKRLTELALANAHGASWLGVAPLDESTWGLVPSGTDLYAGASGMALFLAYLGAFTGTRSHTALAERALRSLRAQAGTWLEAAEEKTEQNRYRPTVGAFDGLGSIIYLFTNLGVLWGNEDLLTDAKELVELLPPLISRDDRLDIIYGSAGCVLSLLGLYAVRPTPRILEVAIQCGDRLVDTARPMPEGFAWKTLAEQPPLGGFSHGTAGISLALSKMAAVTGIERFRQGALDALRYDRSLFVPELDNWADLRVFPARGSSSDEARESAAGPARKSMVAWCHGAPGVGLARLGALCQFDDATIRGEIDSALRATLRYGFEMNHSLCHGALGNVELVLTAARTFERPEDDEALERATARIVASIEANGPVTGVPLGVETPGLMTGLAGIGYELLRLALPDQVPSVLLMEPPSPPGRG
jgi:type 2 lantibiotic biosynthesis protein LanM